jgi:2'-5' RNA ligase
MEEEKGKLHRLFVAVNLDDALKERIWNELSGRLEKEGKKIVEKENLHITIKFLGYFDEKNMNELVEKMKAFEAFRKFELTFNETGHFNRRVLWLGTVNGREGLKALNDKMNELLGLQEERFETHVTLARVKHWKDKDELNDFLKKKLQAVQEVKSVDLMESRLSPKGPSYSVVKKFYLKD